MGVSKPGCDKALNQSGASGFVKLKQTFIFSKSANAKAAVAKAWKEAPSASESEGKFSLRRFHSRLRLSRRYLICCCCFKKSFFLCVFCVYCWNFGLAFYFHPTLLWVKQSWSSRFPPKLERRLCEVCHGLLPFDRIDRHREVW